MQGKGDRSTVRGLAEKDVKADLAKRIRLPPGRCAVRGSGASTAIWPSCVSSSRGRRAAPTTPWIWGQLGVADTACANT